MMGYEFRVIVEKVSVASQKIAKRGTIKIYGIHPPSQFLNLVFDMRSRYLFYQRSKGLY